jgi:hypothetical protein
MLEVQVYPLVPNVVLPTPAPAVTRQPIPSGYGVQEHCLPFTAATALGFLIRSPIAFGLCPPVNVPPDAHAFRSPLDQPRVDGTFEDERVFYVQDDPRCRFIKNAFTLAAVEIATPGGKRLFTPLEPGISFFDREDQLDLFRLHLPYIWRCPPDVDTLFLPAINRPWPGFTVLSGVVETDWYASPVHLIMRKPPGKQSFHVAAQGPIAQAIFVMRSQRRPTLTVVPSHTHTAHEFQTALAQWYQQHREDRSAYKKLARSRHGQVVTEKPS